MFIDDWTRKGLAYDTFFEGDEYHVVQKKNGPGMEIVLNDRETKSPGEEQKFKQLKPFEGYSPRSDKVMSLNDARFDMINKDPSVYSKVKRVSQFSMTKQLDRPALLFGSTHSGTFYDGSKDKVMPRLNAGIPNMAKLQPRKDDIAAKAAKTDLSSLNYDNLVSANTIKVRPKNVALSNLSKQLPRDELLYRQDDRWCNISLENTKEERALKIEARTQQNR